MLHLAALLAGFGGLLLQLAWLRRYGLALGNTSAAAAQVLGVFLAGIGVGGFLAARWRRARAAPLPTASRAYAVVVLFAFAGELLLRSPATLPWGVAHVALLVVPGIPAVCMGVAFPLLFAGLARGAGARAIGGLNAANLLGAVAGAFLGGNFLVPDAGLVRCGQVAGSAYLIAALLVAVRARGAGARVAGGTTLPPPVMPRLTDRERLSVLLAGILLLGCEVLWLRRLPFFLEGFQPTLSGVVSAVLLWNAIGAGLLAPLLARWLGGRALVAAGVGAVLASSAGLHESLAPLVARWPVSSTAGMHLRVLAGASVATALPCLCIGAMLPLALARYVHPETRGLLAGTLCGVQGFGELLGALFAGHALPWLMPQAFFAAAPACLAALAVLLWWRAVGALGSAALLATVGALAGLGISGAGTPWAPHPPARGARHDRPLDHVHLEHAVDATLTASVVYNRRAHSLVLFTDEFRATETGPNTAYMRVLGHLPFLLREDVGRAAVIALGTGATFDAVAAWPQPAQIDVVELSRAVVRVAGRFAADGPVRTGRAPAFESDPRARLHVTDGRAFLARCPPATLDLVTMEPLLPYAPGTAALYSAEFYALAGRALAPAGLLVQWLPTHALPKAMFDSLLVTFAQAFAHVSVWLIDQSTILVGSHAPHAPDEEVLARRYAALPPRVRAALHDAGLPAAADLLAALVSASAQSPLAALPARVLVDDAPFLERLAYWSGLERLSFLPDNLLRLSELVAAEGAAPRWREARMRRISALRNLAQASLPTPGPAALARAVLDLDAARVLEPTSVLLHREQMRATRALYENEIAQSTSAEQAQRIAVRLLQQDAGSALAIAAVGAAARDPAARARGFAAAMALDPLLVLGLPPVLAPAELPADRISPREDLGTLPEGEALAAAACGDGPRAVALRGTFAARVGRAFCAVAAVRPLSDVERGALLPLLDPWLWQELVKGVLARGGDLGAEVLPLWRRDLPPLAELHTILAAPVAARQALADRVGGRRDAASSELLARLLVDADLDVRRAAAVALTRTAGTRIAYDPESPESARAVAAAALRRLHNPPP